MKGFIFDVKHFAVHDGPGIRTTLFLKGCPLRCVWCHNPEGIFPQDQLAYFEHICVNCGKCAGVCLSGAQFMDETSRLHGFDRKKCILCGKCAGVCSAKALSMYGQHVELDEILEVLLADADFYESSNGGVTLSGGECLVQADFCAELLRKLRAHGIHTAVDTCGSVPRETFDKVKPHTNLFLYDVKAIDEAVHLRCTGRSNRRILKNLVYITDAGKDVEVRIPFVPGYNEDQMDKIGAFLSGLDHIVRVKVLPYHNFAGSKYKALDMKDTLPPLLPTDEQISQARRTLAGYGLKVADLK